MNLAKLQCTIQDLNILNGRMMVEFDLKTDYVRHNSFPSNIIFPAFILNHKSFVMTPVLHKIGRWGRYLILSFSSCTILLKMSHRTNIYLTKGNLPKDVEQANLACVLQLLDSEGGEPLYLMYSDPANCGHLSIYPVNQTPSEFSYLGLDVLDSSFCGSYLIAESLKLLSTSRHRGLKSFLMDNRVIAYLDNDVASEVLFVTQLNPLLDVTHELSSTMAHKLAKSIVSTYQNMISHIKNDMFMTEIMPLSCFYAVYGKEICIVCNSKLQKESIEGKITYWCPNCQKHLINATVNNHD